jgi:hypothetical protein
VPLCAQQCTPCVLWQPLGRCLLSREEKLRESHCAAAFRAICIVGRGIDACKAAVPVWMSALLASSGAMVMRKPVSEMQSALATHDGPSARALRAGTPSR